MPGNTEISVVIPVLNESESLPELYSKLKGSMDKLKKKYEIIFIDDGSADNSFEILKEIHLKDSRVKVIKFRKNFGQTVAISAGFDHAKGNVIVTMDSDLQNDPGDISKLLQKMDEGFDVVSGWRADRKDPFTKRIPSMISNFLARHLTSVKIHDFGCTLKAYKREVLNELELYGETHRYIPALVAWKGFKIGEIKVKHYPRKHGKTKYGWKRFIKGILDLILVTFWQRYSTRPIYIFGGLGLLLALLGAFLSGYLGFKRIFFGYPLSDRPALLLAVLTIIIGIQFIATGVLADIMLKVYYGQGLKKNYSIEKTLE
ncbi:MAG: glycosyltransferase family 2 protein [Candidatus Njordarchaeota archaeon]